MRTFLALPVDSELRNSLETHARALLDIEGVTPIEPENYHLTIEFLGKSSLASLEQLDRLFQRRLLTPGPFSLEVEGAGAFPDLESPSVLWAGVEKLSKLIEFVDSVKALTEELGFESDSRDYHPHITLGRVKQNRSQTLESVIQWVQEFGNEPIGRLEVDHLVLFESETKPGGPVYHQRNRWPL